MAGAAVFSELAEAANPTVPASPRFVDATAVAGLSHVYQDAEDAFAVGGGAAAFDCDADRRTDLFLAGGSGPAALFRNRTEPGAPIAFERVEDAAAAMDLAPDALERVVGAYPLEADGDGIVDLFVIRFGRNRLLRGLGGCRFEDISDRLGLPDLADWSAAFAADWAPGDHLPTLAVGNYVSRDRPLQKTGNCDPSYLLTPQAGDPGRYGAPIALAPTGCALSMLFVDWSGSGARDLRVSNDRAYFDAGLGEQLFRIDGTAGAKRARALGREDGWNGPTIWGMGVAASDLDGDSRPEIAVTSMADNRLEALVDPGAGRPEFANRALALGTMSQRPYVGPDLRPSTSWHVAFEDFDNDGRLDLWIVKGNVSAMPDFAAFDPDSLLIGLPDGGFREVGFEAGLALPGRGRGGAAADFNADGLLDLVVVNRGEPARLFQAIPTGGAANWLAIEPRQDGPNSGALGALVAVETAAGASSRVRRVGGGHASGTWAPLHFGLGGAETARVRVRWPDGAWSAWREVSANQVLTIRRAAGEPQERQ